MTHTPTPWEIAYKDENGQRVIKAEHIEICTCWHHCVESIELEMEANAELIVTAVNSHDGLLEALEEAENIIAALSNALVADPDHDPSLAAGAVIIRRQAQTAIQKAKL